MTRLFDPFRLLPALALSLLLLPGARGAEGPRFVATIQPLGMILNELTSGSAQVHILLPAGASPHTYEPKPSDASAAEQALALFYVAESLDRWATALPARERISVLEMVPPVDRLSSGEHGHDHDEHDHAETDPHFWSDPRVVRTLLAPLAEQLARLDPAHAVQYRANAAAMTARMTALDAELRALLAPVRGKGVILFHPSLDYMLHRYEIKLLGVIVASPGKEPSARYLQQIGSLAQTSGARALFTEPQLARRPAEIIAENTGCRLYELDPNGGIEGRRTLEELLLYNARVLREALQ